MHMVSWDALVFLLDAWNIEQRVQLDAEKQKSDVYANYKSQEKHANGILFHKEIEHSHLSLRRNDRVP